MFDIIEFEKWVDAVHNLFELFEGRFDAYPICNNRVLEWNDRGYFSTSETDKEILQSLSENIDYRVFGITGEEAIGKFDRSLRDLITNYDSDNIGLGIAPFLFTWNIQRYKEYFKRNSQFDINQYFENLGKQISNHKSSLNAFSKMKFYDNHSDYGEIKKIFININAELKNLGIGQNEPVGTVKILHILAPYYFPLIDNPIAKAFNIIEYRESLNQESYVRWVEILKQWIENFDKDRLTEIEIEYEKSILKLIDEGLYIMSSIKLNHRIKALGLL